MYVRSLLAASAISLSAAAFLVVPEVLPPLNSVEDVPVSHYAQPVEFENARSEQIQLACDTCPFPEVESDGIVSWSSDTKSTLDLTFSTRDGQIYVNNAHVFPTPPSSVDVKAVQRRESDGKETEALKLGFALVALPLAPPQDGMELLQIRFSPLDIEGHPAPLDTVSLIIVKTAGGDIFIIRSEVETPAGEDDHTSWKECNGDVQCLRRLIFARIQALVQSAKAHMMNLKSRILFGGKGCHGKPRVAHLKHDHDGAETGRFDEPKRPGHRWGPHDHPHPHHHHRHGWRRTISRVVRFIVVPAILGVLAGLTASAIGMIAGQLIVFVWTRYRRNTTSRSTSTLEQGTPSEKAVLMEQDALDEILPPYSDEDHPEVTSTDAK